MPGTNLLVLFGLLLYLGASFALWHILLRSPSSRGSRGRHRRRWPIRLAKALATLVGGAASGAASLLVAWIVVNAGKPGTMSTGTMLAVWVVFTVVAMLFIGRAPLIRRVVTRTGLALGLHGVVLPLATLIAFLVAGARLAGSAGAGTERAVVVMGVRLAGTLPGVWIGLGGFCVGLALIALADRGRRRGRGGRPRDRLDPSRRFRPSRGGGVTPRGRPRPGPPTRGTFG